MIETDAGYGKLGQAAKPSPDADDSVGLLTDRRRPGRAPVSHVLVPLLRGEHDAMMLDVAHEAELVESDWNPVDALRPARGIVYGLLLSLPLWAALLATCHVAIRMITHS